MKSRFIGGILLIVGTSIGGGMLALPVANSLTGFWQSSFFLLLCWAAMTLGALFILEANLYLPPGKHMVSMAAATLGNPGLITAWLSYIFLLYTLLSAYISGGADVFGSLFSRMGISLYPWQSSLLFTLLFGLVVYGGIRQVDLLNRGLMFGKLAVYLLLVILISPHIKLEHFQSGDYRYIAGTIMILITSFGFAIIVPNLRDYFNDDIKTLKKVVMIGSLIPLLCYIAWDAVIMGTLSVQGDKGLAALMQDEHTTSSLALNLSAVVKNTLISSLFNFFTSICMLTAFLGVSLCLISFLADGLKMEQKGRQGLGLFLLTFLPPLLIVVYYPGAYIHALNYAGIFCVILLLLLPALMTVFGRKKFTSSYQVPGGKWSQWLIIVFSIILLANTAWQLMR
ncbi:amino acid permease [Legionella jordanis]|uniref:Tyrosine-specific transport protein n=1 Tax=Legionella jordanis TaxID=456 RepID=A0A0W0VB16_9GAMM|nr:aromatic amino acid transport family protein [Legionella jordanis]KTD16857.1 tyrosine-specific transport protein [Legionella jordanis]RMX00357.1 tryptophan/tyrosine permease [Legionella jordanis]RMX15537.1 tryptophan/tyrosine permease [Legionella jordanis]VEH13554.1 tyrosine-specific transport protein [Legionella jordanis]